jgi:saccharopine dehydrogenase (NAD+, L-lysine forming)
MNEYSVAVTCNACICQTNHSVLEACLRAGSHYIDMAADIYSPPGVKRAGKNSFEAEIEKFNDAYLDRGIAGILCMGMDPGAVNVFARWAIDRLDTASSIRVLDADNAEVRGYRFAVLFSPETFFEELGATPITSRIREWSVANRWKQRSNGYAFRNRSVFRKPMQWRTRKE